MNATGQTTGGHGSGNWIAFTFGAVFNVLGNVDLSFLLDYTLQALIGGIICLFFKIIGDVLSPLWQDYKEKIRKLLGPRKKQDNDRA